ncbi:hypothetical protein DPEC_G00342190 [Dallia pectoralis]|uniref:Uncharacterized protein n=1 Tax=Dallia pectoralis TaxID=75939 RepID=A0ACC2F5U1_DALPE|nr:hypothetical protein DPEC_G00342190 [Dallia pectoralis]
MEGNLESLLDMTHGAVCAGCHRLICDRYLFRVNTGLWHEQCIRCAACCDPLKYTCFLRDQKLYCKRDYVKCLLFLCLSVSSSLFAVRCRGCVKPISPAELVMHAGTAVFHLACFSCSVCACRLQTGDCFVFRDGRLLCARDLDQEEDRCPSSDSGNSDEEKEEEASVKVAVRRNGEADVSENKQPKRPRTILSTQQRRAFKASFEISSKPCRKVREALAMETRLSVRVVQVWFQNQRAKMKKLSRRQQQQQQQQPTQEHHDHTAQHSATSCDLLNSDLKTLGSYHQPSAHPQLQGRVTPLEQLDMEPFRHRLTPPQMPGDHMYPYGNKALYMQINRDPPYHLDDANCLSYGDSSLLTPIDCLYSMQDSYFTS